MILEKQLQKPSLLPATAFFVFSAGISFCGIIWLLTIYFMVTTGSDDVYYLLSKRCGPLSYVGWTTLIFFGFCLMAVLLIPSRKKIYSAALFVSCLSIAFNTRILSESARLLHIEAIRSTEHTMDSIIGGGDFYYREELWQGQEGRSNYMPRLKRYYSHVVDRWREIEGPDFQPVENAYWSEAEKASFDNSEFTCWRACREKSNSTLPLVLFFSANGKAAGLLADGTRLFGFANPEAARTNDFHHDCIVFNLESDEWSFDFLAEITNGVMHAEPIFYGDDETMEYHLQDPPEMP